LGVKASLPISYLPQALRKPNDCTRKKKILAQHVNHDRWLDYLHQTRDLLNLSQIHIEPGA
jgi:hypothetical protein